VGLLQQLVLLLAADPLLVRGLAMLAALTEELLDLTASAKGVRLALYAVETDCSCTSTCCCCLCTYGCS